MSRLLELVVVSAAERWLLGSAAVLVVDVGCCEGCCDGCCSRLLTVGLAVLVLGEGSDVAAQ